MRDRRLNFQFIPKWHYLKWVPLVLLLILGSVACIPTTPLPAPSPTNTAVATGTPTPTTIWFPPTATYTPYPTPVITPTLDIQPQVGEIILSDDFSDPSLWNLSKTNTSNVAIGNNRLSLATDQPEAYLYTLRREPTLNNFYLEITANPSLCKGLDEYGLLLRVSPALDFYRFSLSCNGQIRVDKYYQGIASSPQPWTLSGAVPPGAPSSSRLSVWANGKEMRFYVNDEYQFAVRDPALQSGSIGVFIRSAQDNPVSVSFSDLTVYRIP